MESVTSTLMITFNGDLVVSMEITVDETPSCGTSPTLTQNVYSILCYLCGVGYLYCIHTMYIIYFIQRDTFLHPCGFHHSIIFPFSVFWNLNNLNKLKTNLLTNNIFLLYFEKKCGKLHLTLFFPS